MFLLTLSALSLLTLPTSLALPATANDKPFYTLDLPAANSADNLLGKGLACAPERGDYAHSVEVLWKDCAEAIGKTRSEGTLNFLVTRLWSTDAEGTSDEPVPQYWQFNDGTGGPTCYMVVSGPRKKDREMMSLAALTHHGSVVLNSCLKPILPDDTGRGFGGRFEIKDQGFFVDITGNLPSGAQPYVNRGADFAVPEEQNLQTSK